MSEKIKEPSAPLLPLVQYEVLNALGQDIESDPDFTKKTHFLIESENPKLAEGISAFYYEQARTCGGSDEVMTMIVAAMKMSSSIVYKALRNQAEIEQMRGLVE